MLRLLDFTTTVSTEYEERGARKKRQDESQKWCGREKTFPRSRFTEVVTCIRHSAKEARWVCGQGYSGQTSGQYYPHVSRLKQQDASDVPTKPETDSTPCLADGDRLGWGCFPGASDSSTVKPTLAPLLLPNRSGGQSLSSLAPEY